METSSMCEHKCCGLYHCALISTIKKKKTMIGTSKMLLDNGDEEDAAV